MSRLTWLLPFPLFTFFFLLFFSFHSPPISRSNLDSRLEWAEFLISLRSNFLFLQAAYLLLLTHFFSKLGRFLIVFLSPIPLLNETITPFHPLRKRPMPSLLDSRKDGIQTPQHFFFNRNTAYKNWFDPIASYDQGKAGINKTLEKDNNLVSYVNVTPCEFSWHCCPVFACVCALTIWFPNQGWWLRKRWRKRWVLKDLMKDRKLKYFHPFHDSTQHIWVASSIVSSSFFILSLVGLSDAWDARWRNFPQF